MNNKTDSLHGGVAVITGAGSGIGAGLARHAAKCGMKVVLADIVEERIRQVADEITASGGSALCVPTDVTRFASLEALADTAYDAYGDVRLLINNAGVETVGFSWEIPVSTWDKALAININGVVYGVRVFAPRMLASGNRCFIANTASVGGFGIAPLQAPYIMSKHAVISFSECLHLDMQVKGASIDVSVIVPGPVNTKIFTDTESGQDSISKQHHKTMKTLLEQEGMTGDEAAQIILPQIADSQFWISTHPEWTKNSTARRATILTDLATPELTAELKALL